MRFLLAVSALSLLLAGCFAEEPKPSAVDYARVESNQTHHYRPIHRDNTSWSARRLGKTLTVRTGDGTIKLTVRRDPDKVLMRLGGVVVGSVAKNGNGIQVSSSLTAGAISPVSLNCTGRNTAALVDNGTVIRYRLEPALAAGDRLSVRDLEDPHRTTIYDTADFNANPESCIGTELDSPFNATGTLIFHEDRVLLASRAALAWYVTVFGFGCDDQI